jgi:hypothetical protein
MCLKQRVGLIPVIPGLRRLELLPSGNQTPGMTWMLALLSLQGFASPVICYNLKSPPGMTRALALLSLQGSASPVICYNQKSDARDDIA